MSKVKLTIDGVELGVAPGTTILEAARMIGADVPTLCHHRDLAPNGACRLCVVEVEKAKTLLASCVTPVAPGMVVHTESERVVNARKDILRLLVANHPLVCIVCEKTGDCKLQDYCYRYDIDDSHYQGEVKELALDDSNEFFSRDMNKCILCGICVGLCQEISGAGAIDFLRRGFTTNVGPAYEDKIEASPCTYCGLCIDNCPVGALIPKSVTGKGRPFELKTSRAVCPYCSVGCTVYLHANEKEITQVTGDQESPVNRGHLCAKGKFGWDYQQSEERITAPLVKSGGVFIEVSWQEALSFVVDNLDRVRTLYGDDVLMGLFSPDMTNEEGYLYQKLIRSLGTNNIDSFTRFCHAPALDALKHTLGSTAMTNTIDELAHAGAIFIIEANPEVSHPVISYRVREALRRGASLITAGESLSGLGALAKVNLSIKGENAAMLVSAMAHVILEEGLYDEKYVGRRTEGFAEFKNKIAAFDLEKAEAVLSVSAEEIKEAARLFAKAPAAAVISNAGGMAYKGGKELAYSLINLSLLTGNIGKESSGLYLLYDESNLQGCLDMGIQPDLLTGFQAVSDKQVKEKFSKAWQVNLSEKPGLTAGEAFDPQAASHIKAMLIIGENPASPGAFGAHAAGLLGKLDFLLVQDMFMTETAALADVIFPAAAFAEKMGTYTNMERRVQLNMPVVDPPGEVFPDWRVIAELAGWLGFEWAYESVEDVFDEMAALTPQYSGINYSRLSREGLQWPCPATDHPGTKVLYEGRFRRGLGLFYLPEEPEKSSLANLSCSPAANEMRKRSVIGGL